MRPRYFPIPLAACLASPLPAQEDEIQGNRAAMLKNAPSVSKDGRVMFTLGLVSAAGSSRPDGLAKLARILGRDSAALVQIIVQFSFQISCRL